MIRFWFDLVVIVLGFGTCALLFWRIPLLPRGGKPSQTRLSVIIPARNEEKTLPLLLQDLRAQDFVPHEIIVVNDESEDDTESVARKFGASVLNIHGKPEGWVGKCWACHTGAKAATGTSLLFLDADVRLAPDGLGRIMWSTRRTALCLCSRITQQSDGMSKQRSCLIWCRSEQTAPLFRGRSTSACSGR